MLSQTTHSTGKARNYSAYSKYSSTKGEKEKDYGSCNVSGCSSGSAELGGDDKLRESE